VDSVFVSVFVVGGGTFVIVFVVVVFSFAPVSDLAGGFTIVVLFSVFFSAGAAAGVTVSVFCSHAPRSAALAKMQINFFIVLIGLSVLGTKPESEQGEFPVLRK